MWTNRTLERIDEMLTEAIEGEFTETRYDETKLSRLESKWKQYLGASGSAIARTAAERESIKSMVSDISHQTKTPLSNILLYSELIQEVTSPEQARLLAGQIKKQAEKLEFLIQALVKMSRLETEILEVVPRKQDICKLVEEAVAGITVKAAEKNIRLCVEVPRGNDKVINAFYDKKWTLEALYNILENAIKYSPENSTVNVEVRQYEMYVCIAVTDEGMGIEEAERARIFKRFYRSPHVQQEEGVGIGLYLASEILKKEKGYIKVTSKPGKGSCFGLYLPKA